MKTKPKTPYQHLLEDFRQFAFDCKHRHTKEMWTYPKERLSEGWSLASLSERIQAAEQLGYDVMLVSNNAGINVVYVKKMPDIPWQAR